MLNAWGLGMLFCVRGEYVDIFVVGPSRTWSHEATVPAWANEIERVEVADDGTVLVATPCFDQGHCIAMIRRPVEIGALDPWWTPALPGAAAFRLLGGGEVAALTYAKLDEQQVAVKVWRLRSGRRPELVANVAMAPPLRSFSVRGRVIRVNDFVQGGG